jgi:indolepyruvate ferredoxin oxidoreductase, beta subunit
MKYDIIVAGVGGQGVVSVGAIIAESAVLSGLCATQSEVHGMSQRGGSVISHLRLSDRRIESGTIGEGRADLIIAMEPLEALRHLEFLSGSGRLIVNDEPVRNIPSYPDLDDLIDAIGRFRDATIVDAVSLARRAGSAKAANVVMVGAAAASLPVAGIDIRRVIEKWFRAKGEKVMRINLDAFEIGQEATQCRAA